MNNPQPKGGPPQKKGTQQQQAKTNAPRRRTARKNPAVPRNIPAAYTGGAPRPKAASIRNFGKSCRIVHSEFFHDVLGTTAGHFIAHIITPTNPGVFPWLSGMANMYESYVFNYLRFRYKNIVGTNYNGMVAMAPDYDNNDGFPASKSNLLTWDDKASCSAYQTCVVDCSSYNLRKRATYFTGAVPVGKDPNLYYVANLILYTGACMDTSQIGEIYVEYDVTFTTPQASVNTAPDGLGGLFWGTSNSAPFGNVGVSNNLISQGIVSAPVMSGTTTSLTEWTFLKHWRGYITTNFTGTGLTAIIEGGSANLLNVFTEIGFGTQVADCVQCHAEPGQTFSLSMGNTTLTRCDSVWGQSPNPLA